MTALYSSLIEIFQAEFKKAGYQPHSIAMTEATEALEAAIAAMGDASTRKDEDGCSVSATDKASPANTSEIPLISDTYDIILKALSDNAQILCGDNNKLVATDIAGRLDDAGLISTTKPVSVSLEKVAHAMEGIALITPKGTPTRDITIAMAKAVLEAAGVKYHD